MGYAHVLFKTQLIVDEFICFICLVVLREPVVTAPCEHIFCRSCIEKWHAQAAPRQATCPTDRQPVKELRAPPRVFINMWNKLELHRPFKDIGCLKVLSLGTLTDHE